MDFVRSYFFPNATQKCHLKNNLTPLWIAFACAPKMPVHRYSLCVYLVDRSRVTCLFKRAQIFAKNC